MGTGGKLFNNPTRGGELVVFLWLIARCQLKTRCSLCPDIIKKRNAYRLLKM